MSTRCVTLFVAASLCGFAVGGAECRGQQRPDWRTAMSFPRVDMSRLGTTRTNEVVVAMRQAVCPCGCGMKLAECLIDDPNCTHSPPAAANIVQASWDVPRVHVLTVADRLDKSIGPDCEADAANLEGLIQDSVDNRLLETEEFSEASAEWKKRLTAQNVLARIGSLKVAPHDTVLFYYSGHGGYTAKDGHLFHMPHGGVELRRSTVLAALKKHNAKLTVLISDTCFTKWPGKEPGVAARAWNERTRPLMRSLFFQSSGVVDVTSSQQDEVSMCYPVRAGSLFTGAFQRVVEANLDRNLAWPAVFQAVSDDTQMQFRFFNPNGVANGRSVQRTQTPLAFELAALDQP
ncbi:caspase family protein [Alienimonas chondri]|uniref:Peptidase C14 caspase domain-containing protein n=1 Tax=Alienimonas chondri TaxID=2681879 RepID=A0ABX1VDF7_9PLAN|nr:caspase family protein [Alienimonas chondri]NNJ26142.1 hypothetical protein [Alienimonas chondri]